MMPRRSRRPSYQSDIGELEHLEDEEAEAGAVLLQATPPACASCGINGSGHNSTVPMQSPLKGVRA